MYFYTKILVSIFILSIKSTALSYTETGHIQQVIHSTISVKRVSDLIFPDSYAGAPSTVVQAGTTESRSNASFLVTGDANKKVKIFLPSGKIQLRNLNSKDNIIVKNLRYNTSNRSVLDRNGELMIYVGGTREQISTRVHPGVYTGTFLVTVIY